MRHTRFPGRWMLSIGILLFGWFFVSSVPGWGTKVGQGAKGAAQTPQETIQIQINQVVASGLTNPIEIVNAGDGSGRLFVLEQRGKVRIVTAGQVLATPFLDISADISCCGELGLLGIAFDPQFAANGYFYVDYTRKNDNATVIRRFQVSNNPNIAQYSSGFILLEVGQPFANHNGGKIAFAEDGYLYIALGDGGSGGDPFDNAQDKDSLLGKILRIDVHQPDPGLAYGIPGDNPFYGPLPGRDEIWSWGLRNPWRFSFDRLTGDLYIGDVGQGLWEEIDFQPVGYGGLNFGWRCYEGSHTYNLNPPCQGPLTFPVAEYSHSEGQSVTGGYVYRGSAYPRLTGYYFYADFGSGKIWTIRRDDQGNWSPAQMLIDTNVNISSFGEDEAGELYVADYYGGTIRLLADVIGPSPDLSASQKLASVPNADIGETITYTIHLVNRGGADANPLAVVDTLPVDLTYITGSLKASNGAVDDSDAKNLKWSGGLLPGADAFITYRVQVSGVNDGNRTNTALITGPGNITISLDHTLLVPGEILATTPADFILPGTQPEHLADPLLLPVGCDVCHTSPIYDTWQGSMMSQAGRDPLFWAALEIANRDAPGSGEYCLRCHLPKGWLEGRAQAANGSGLSEADFDLAVGCEICHRAIDPVAGGSDEAASYDNIVRSSLEIPPAQDHQGSAMLVIDPFDNRRGPFSLGLNFSPHPKNTYQTDFLGGEPNDFVARSRLCAACHNVDNPVLSWNGSQFMPNAMGQPAPSFNQDQLFPVETTYDEWLNSAYSTPPGVFAPQFSGAKKDGYVGACQDCHMPRSTGTAAEAAYTPTYRDCITTGCLPLHEFIGGNSWVPQLLLNPAWRLNALPYQKMLAGTPDKARSMLQRAATLSVNLVQLNGGGKEARVRVTNQSGHKLPTGYSEGRRMWLNVKAFDASGNVLKEYGHYDSLSGILVQDSTVYEVLQGLTPQLASQLGMNEGESFHFLLNNTVIKDNRIPPRGYTQNAYDRPGLRPVGATYLDGEYWDDVTFSLPGATVRVLVTLYYQTASKEYIDFLRNNGGNDATALGELWDTLKSPPEVMSRAWSPNYPNYFPLINR